MKRQAYQHPEIRDANDSIIQAGTYGKESPLVNSTNDGVLDYINNNLEALRDNINGSRIYVKNKDALTTPGDISAMYIAEDTGKWYLWDGTKYIETDNARKIADEAIAARDAAKDSQTAAKTSETAAKASETAAKSSETAAKTSEENAANSKTAAAASQTAAKASETSAAESAAAAALAATQATAGQINADWNAESGVAQILNKPVIDTTVTDGSTNLVTSGAVANAIATAITNIIDGNGVSY